MKGGRTSCLESGRSKTVAEVQILLAYGFSDLVLGNAGVRQFSPGFDKFT
jgi:hypothetical protein